MDLKIDKRFKQPPLATKHERSNDSARHYDDCSEGYHNVAGQVYPVKKAHDLPVQITTGDEVAANYSDF